MDALRQTPRYKQLKYLIADQHNPERATKAVHIFVTTDAFKAVMQPCRTPDVEGHMAKEVARLVPELLEAWEVRLANCPCGPGGKCNGGA